jgi:3-hydroxyisobutyrate dehydrogenase
MESAMQLGFVGLGDQGGPIARRLIDSGHAMTLWARRAEALAPFADTNATIADDLRQLAQRCDWIGICVFDDAGVTDVCATIMPDMRPGGSIVIHSTVHPDTCRRLAGKAASHGLMFLDAPVSGGNAGARAGTLTVMVGATAEAFAISEPLFTAYSSLVRRLGEPGTGQVAKLINNMLMAANAALGHAALTTGEGLGLDRDALVNIVNASSGRSFGFETYSAAGGLVGFARGAGILTKDVGLLENCVSKEDPILPFLRLTQSFLTESQTAKP